MKSGELDRLEREAEAARSRLVGGLARLRSNDQLSQVRQRLSSEVTQGKGELVNRVKDTTRERADGVMAEIKARVAANPGAALAIGAGLAWRLYRHPPVTTMLVGAGLMALMRTDPNRPAAGAHLAARAVDLAGSARGKVEEWRAGDTGGGIGEKVQAARERVGEVAESAREQVAALTETAHERFDEWRSEAGPTARRRIREAARTADQWTAAGQRAVARAMPESSRDRYLLGVAALALAAAVGVAGQRRMAEDEEARRSSY